MNSIHNEGRSLSSVKAGQTVERLFELAILLVDGLEGGLASRGLTRARAELIWQLHHQGPLTQRTLSQALRCTPRNVTTLVDALQADGFVTREAHPTDRRATLVTLTAQGRETATEMQAGYQQFARSLFEGLAADDLASFAAVLEQLLGRLRNVASATREQP